MTTERARSYGLVGPIARASGVQRDFASCFHMRRMIQSNSTSRSKQEGDGYARLRVFFREAEQSAAIIVECWFGTPQGPVCAANFGWRAGAALARGRSAAGRGLPLAENSTKTALSRAIGSPRPHSRTGMAFISRRKISRSRTFRSFSRASDCRMPSAIDRGARWQTGCSKGLRTGIKTTAYPRQSGKRSRRISRAAPLERHFDSDADAEEPGRAMPDQARSRRRTAESAIDHGRCIHCFRCRRDADERSRALGRELRMGQLQTRWRGGSCANWKTSSAARLHIRFVDAGACGACMSEARQLNNPYYNMHRLGFFMTPTPRNADVLLGLRAGF